jgi:protein-S-isoprenylcysteine O-methyltransferase Ste14
MFVRLLVHSLAWFGGMGALMFVSAGTLNWPGAWIFLAEMAILGVLMGTSLGRRDPGLLRERLSSPLQKDQTPADKIVLPLLLLLMMAWLVFMAFDAVRFGWSSVPAWIQAIGVVSVALSIWAGYRTMLENSFAAPVVKIQQDRGQSVITTGPYGYVRHPMYAGTIPYFIGVPLVLGSWWGLAWVPAFMAILAVRIAIEEQALRTGLPGYDAYAMRVRYRLIPRVW